MKQLEPTRRPSFRQQAAYRCRDDVGVKDAGVEALFQGTRHLVGDAWAFELGAGYAMAGGIEAEAWMNMSMLLGRGTGEGVRMVSPGLATTSSGTNLWSSYDHVSPMNKPTNKAVRPRDTYSSHRNLDNLALARGRGRRGRRCCGRVGRVDGRLGKDGRRHGRRGQEARFQHAGGCGIRGIGRSTALWREERERERGAGRGRRLGLPSNKAFLGRGAALSLTAANRWRWRRARSALQHT